jgi:hypothetical protein
MKQIYHNYTKWEDFKNGMWLKVEVEKENEMLQKAITFTGDHEMYGKAMLRVIKEWPITCEHHLTDNAINKKAFIGHCAVCLELGIPEYIVRMAWHYLTKEQQDLANNAADKAISKWLLIHNKANQIELI